LASFFRHAYLMVSIDTEYYEPSSIIYFSLCRHKRKRERIYKRIGKVTKNDNTSVMLSFLHLSAARGRADGECFTSDQLRGLSRRDGGKQRVYAPPCEREGPRRLREAVAPRYGYRLPRIGSTKVSLHAAHFRQASRAAALTRNGNADN